MTSRAHCMGPPPVALGDRTLRPSAALPGERRAQLRDVAVELELVPAVGDEDEAVRVAIVEIARIEDDGAAAGYEDVRADSALDERAPALVRPARRPAELRPGVPDHERRPRGGV